MYFNLCDTANLINNENAKQMISIIVFDLMVFTEHVCRLNVSVKEEEKACMRTAYGVNVIIRSWLRNVKMFAMIKSIM